MTAIQIDLPGVEEVIAELRKEVEEGLTRTVDEGLRTLPGPLPFGERSPSAEVRCARQANTDSVDVQLSNLTTHLSNAHNLVTGLQLVVDDYRRADIRLAAGFDVVNVTSPLPDDSPLDMAPLMAGAVGPIAPPALPDQPEYRSGYCLDWGAYNVPRLAAILQPEGSRAAYEKARAYDNCGGGLDSHREKMTRLMEKLAHFWVPDSSPAAVAYFERFSAHISAVAQDALCAETTAKGLDEVVENLGRAKLTLAGYKRDWDGVTTDFVPEFWDHAAEEVNAKGQRAMAACDEAIADWRKSIIVPQVAPAHTNFQSETVKAENHTRGGTAAAAQAVVPPVPGYNPVVGPTLSMTAAAGAPTLTQASPANPPSMLPVPPGVHQAAPGGGAWMLPGPGVGPRGRLVVPGKGIGAVMTAPAATPRPASGVIGPAAAARTAPSSIAGGVIGGHGPAKSRKPEGDVRPGTGDQLWQVRHGVTPVIDRPGEAAQERQATPLIGEGRDSEFAAWYRGMAEPWEGS